MNKGHVVGKSRRRRNGRLLDVSETRGGSQVVTVKRRDEW